MKRNPASWPTGWPSTITSPARVTAPVQRAAVLHPAQQMGLAAVDEALGQRAMQRVGELVLHRARALLPMRRNRRASRRGARYRSRCGYGRCGPSGCRYRPRRCRGARHGPRPSRSAASPRPTVRCRKIWPSSRAWASLITLRKSGIWQTSQSRRTVAGPPIRAADLRSSPASCASACWSSASRARSRAGSGERRSRLRAQRYRWNGNRDRCCATCRAGSASKRWFSIASTISGASGPTSAVVPKLPSFICRPARPAICASSAAESRRGRAAVELARARRRRHGPDPC